VTTPTLLTDFYKQSHFEQYPKNTEMIYSTWTPRISRLKNVDKVVAFGFQAFIKKFLMDYFNENFFSRPKAEVVGEHRRVIQNTLGGNPRTDHIEALHDLGYLPLRIRAVKEGSRIPIGIPILTIENTKPEFFWLTNYIETLMSCELWQPTTSATIAYEYRKLLDFYADSTGGDMEFVKFQGHDFSMRGMSCLEASKSSGAGHLLSFTGTDTIPAIMYLEEFYGADIEKSLVGTSIPATEHSVMEAYGQNEFESYKRLITEVYPKGFVSIVSDTWNLWKVLNEVIRPLKDVIMAREGRVVIRPDSGDPVTIICGDPNSDDENERKGVLQILWEIFGGTITEKGYRQLDSHIGCIYGDAITLLRCEEICQRLLENKFASTNMVYGIGSFTYQYNTRDTFGFALKTTFGVFGGEEKKLFKDPVTDTGKFKKSHCGMVVVRDFEGQTRCIDGMFPGTRAAVLDDLLEDVFIDGELVREESLEEIRGRLLG